MNSYQRKVVWVLEMLRYLKYIPLNNDVVNLAVQVIDLVDEFNEMEYQQDQDEEFAFSFTPEDPTSGGQNLGS